MLAVIFINRDAERLFDSVNANFESYPLYLVFTAAIKLNVVKDELEVLVHQLAVGFGCGEGAYGDENVILAFVIARESE